jgi:segregation and condensation protein B
MSDADVLPEVKQIVGAMFFTQRQPLTAKQILKVFPQAAEHYAGVTVQYAQVGEDDVEAAITQFREELDRAKLGFHLIAVAGGWRLQNDRVCGPWVRTLLEKGKPSRLSRPALETLSIVAYRQPISRADIEAIRGVSADAIIRNLLEMGLVKVAGRSELPGRPWLFGTTQMFLESFGLNSLDDLPGMEELRRNAKQAEQKQAEQKKAEQAAKADAAKIEQGAAALAKAGEAQANVVEPTPDVPDETPADATPASAAARKDDDDDEEDDVEEEEEELDDEEEEDEDLEDEDEELEDEDEEDLDEDEGEDLDDEDDEDEEEEEEEEDEDEEEDDRK